MTEVMHVVAWKARKHQDKQVMEFGNSRLCYAFMAISVVMDLMATPVRTTNVKAVIYLTAYNIN